jgi:integrase
MVKKGFIIRIVGSSKMAEKNHTRKQLSTLAINNMKPGNELKDVGENAGLYVRRGKRGDTVFYYRYKQPKSGLIKRVPIGIYTIGTENLERSEGKQLIGLATARTILKRYKEERKSGGCPRTRIDAEFEVKRMEEHRQKNRLTVKDVVEVYLTQHIEDHLHNGKRVDGVRKIKGQKEVRRILEGVCGKDESSDFGAKFADEISHTDIKREIIKILERGANAMAGDTLRELNLAFNFCIGRPRGKDIYLPEELINPCLQAKEYFKGQSIKLTSKKGTRALSDAELVKFLSWLEDAPLTRLNRYIMIITLLTGCRTGEVTKAIKTDFDLKRGTWHLRDTKTGVERFVQLSHQCAHYLKMLLDDPRNNTPYLLPTKEGRPQNQAQLSQQGWKMRQRGTMLSIPHWSPHDLRRTVRTGLSRLQCPHDVAEAILGHSKKGMAGVYDLNKHEPECKEWLQRWADHLSSIAGRNLCTICHVKP